MGAVCPAQQQCNGSVGSVKSPKRVWLRFCGDLDFLEKIRDRHERSGITVQWNGGAGVLRD